MSIEYGVKSFSPELRSSIVGSHERSTLSLELLLLFYTHTFLMVANTHENYFTVFLPMVHMIDFLTFFFCVCTCRLLAVCSCVMHVVVRGQFLSQFFLLTIRVLTLKLKWSGCVASKPSYPLSQLVDPRIVSYFTDFYCFLILLFHWTYSTKEFS